MIVTAVALFLALLAILWLLALELRFHSLKSLVGESEQLAHEAASEADQMLAKVREHLAAEKVASKPRKR